MLTNLQKLGRDAYFGNGAKSSAECDRAIRNLIEERCGKVPAERRKFRRWMKENGNRYYEIIEELVEQVHNELGVEDFGSLVRRESFDLGDKKEFIVKNDKMFDVALVATGMKTVHRQRIHDRKVPTVEFKLAAKTYAEDFELLTGILSFAEYVDRIHQSFAKKEAALVGSTLMGAYDKVANPTFCVEAAAAGLDEKLREMLAKVDANNLQIVGTQSALAKIKDATVVADADKDDRRNFGYVKVFEGVPCVKIPNYFDAEVGKFQIDPNKLLIVPADEQLVFLNIEGGVSIYETPAESRDDLQSEMDMQEIVQLGVLVAKKYAIINIK